MSRGFGATYGSASTDIITAGLTSPNPGQRSYFIWGFAHSAGGGSLARFWTHSADTIADEDVIINGPVLSYFAKFTTTNGQWDGTLPSFDAWHSYLITYDNTSTSNTPTFYVDGSAGTPTTITAPVGTPSNITQAFGIGNRTSGLNRVFDGYLAWFTVWDNVLLGQGEATALANGAMPFRIRPSSIVSCIPMFGLTSPEVDFGTHGTATVSGALKQPNPPTSMFTSRWPQNIDVAAAAPATTAFRRTLSPIGTRTGSRQAA